jgi:ribonuclease HI
MKKKPMDPLTTAPLTKVLEELNIKPEDWDAIIIGDGSGTDWKNSCGWGAVLIDHYGNYRVPFSGASSTGTSQLAELIPYLWALTWYDCGPGKARLKDRIANWKLKPNHGVTGPWSEPELPPGVKVHIITDNTNLANQGNGLVKRKAYGPLWKAFDGFVAEGYQLRWHWVARQRLGLNRLVDLIAGKCRLAIEKVVMPEGLTLFDFNPPEPTK